MPRVILYKGSFRYDVVNVFVDELARGLATLGREAALIDLTAESANARVENELSRPFECIVAFGAIGSRPHSALPGTHMYDRLAAPYVAVLVDHPSCHLDRFTIDNMILTCHDRTHVAFLRRYFGGAKRVEFLPHGGSAVRPDGIVPVDRPIGILFIGTYADPDAEYASLRASLAPDDFDIMDFVIELLLTKDCEPMEDALSAVLSTEGREDEWRRLCRYLPAVEAFVKPYKRLEVLRGLDDAGQRVEIVGNWPGSLFRHHTIQPPRPYHEALRLMRRSKIVLNTSFVPDGSHERVFSAILNGALPLSDYNPYLAESFPGQEDMSVFRWTQLERLPETVSGLLDDPTRLESYPSKAAQLGQAHTWAARAASLLAIVRDAGGTQPVQKIPTARRG